MLASRLSEDAGASVALIEAGGPGRKQLIRYRALAAIGDWALLLTTDPLQDERRQRLVPGTAFTPCIVDRDPNVRTATRDGEETWRDPSPRFVIRGVEWMNTSIQTTGERRRCVP